MGSDPSSRFLGLVANILGGRVSGWGMEKSDSHSFPKDFSGCRLAYHAGILSTLHVSNTQHGVSHLEYEVSGASVLG